MAFSSVSGIPRLAFAYFNHWSVLANAGALFLIQKGENTMTNTQTGNTHRFTAGKGFESIPREMLQNTADLSFGAIGLLSYMLSKPDTWTFRKTWLYDTPEIKDKRRAIQKYWQELVDFKYIIQFQKRTGSKNEYEYYFNNSPFTTEQIKDIQNEIGLTACAALNQSDKKVAPKKVTSTPTDSESPAQKKHNKSQKDKTKDTVLSPDQFLFNFKDQQLTENEMAKLKQNLDEIHAAKSWSRNTIDQLPDEIWKSLESDLKRTNIVFDFNTLGTQLDRFTEIYLTKGISADRINYYFLNGLKDFESVAINGLGLKQAAH